MRADYTYTDARDDTTDLELLRRPRHKASVSATWRRLIAAFHFRDGALRGSQVDGDRSFTIQRLDTPDYYLVNLAADYDIGHGATVFARIDNLLDHRYENPTGFERPGFRAYAGCASRSAANRRRRPTLRLRRHRRRENERRSRGAADYQISQPSFIGELCLDESS